MGIRCPAGQMRGRFDYCLPSPIVFDVPSSPGGFEFIQVCGFCDFPFDFAQNDRGGRHNVKMVGLGLEEPTKRESGVMGIGFFLMQVHWFF